MKRTIIHIDEKKCVGCGLCVTACHEGAIGMVDGKAKLLRMLDFIKPLCKTKLRLLVVQSWTKAITAKN